ncbi:hypothetical protein CERZMDRAFT_59824 [Cercospora zeae-maydis SCOH1-5]|uniref:Trafficking protein particle complex subunit 11 domain-containing protein n=1 Tax=Cercospora zeae-maydis SCOH1-5 TaxID=717836 RepID=A0A6A6FDD8_9PEZI|nr:hypothetical protein CERZMDRAFT_59824 [Cercospora zeae-maydis SCOH1-5]
MEAYPPHYVQHNLPLVLLSGLGQLDLDSPKSPPARQESGARISTESPECHSDQAKRLLQAFRSLDGTDSAWNSSALPGPTSSIRFKIKTVGRAYSLPPRKAAPLPQSPGAEGPHIARNTELHSPLSPLSPGSPVFPDGVFTPLWLQKHQEQVPCLVIAAFQINANEASQDERLRADINAIRNALTRSLFKTRFAVLLISDRSILEAPDLEDRLGMVRRGTSLDSKSGLFFMPPMGSDAEIETFVQDTMKVLQPQCVDYYRDLTKHARRKKARGGPPPLSHTPVGGASHATTQSGWNVRYEFKQAVFAEFRQEMDVAERHFSAALEELFGAGGGVLETTTNWSPRWNEARLLSDVTALRILRCQLWLGQTTSSVQAWINYKLRMKDLIDRRGKGSGTYSWAAWESRWAAIMSQLIQRAEISSLRRPPSESSDLDLEVFAEPERAALAADRLPPWYFLHHPGYWLRLLSQGVRARWERARAIPDEDRLSPGQSPASSVANRWKTYDAYLVPDPHEEMSLTAERGHDHVSELGTACMHASEEFAARQQLRMSEQIRLELAEDLISAGRQSGAIKILTEIWEHSTWREDEWHIPFERLLRMLLDCAHQAETGQYAAILPAVVWELLAIARDGSPNMPLDLSNCLPAPAADAIISITNRDGDRLCPFTVSFAFDTQSSYVGESQQFQLTMMLDTAAVAKPIQLASVHIRLGKKHIRVRHEGGSTRSPAEAALMVLPSFAEHDDSSPDVAADLLFRPQSAKTLQFEIMLREAQVCRVDEVTINVKQSMFNLEHVLADHVISPSRRWQVRSDEEVASVLLPHLDTKAIIILPKPPKLQILLPQLRKQYFTDEHIRLLINVINEENETISGTITPGLAGTSEDSAISLRWADDDASGPSGVISELAASSSITKELLLQAPTEASSIALTLEVQYALTSDLDTTLSKAVTFDLSFVPAFEAKFAFSPRLHPEPWPSYFSNAAADTPTGIKQQWGFGAQLSSLTDQDVLLRTLELVIHEVQGEASCTVRDALRTDEVVLTARSKHTSDFELTSQKLSLDDRRPSHIDLSLIATWSVGNALEKAETIITVPRLTIPTSEPRVLCTVEQDQTGVCPVLCYHLENPSAHFLTFALTMEASDSFGFSGPKYRALSLAPLSRSHVEYRLQLHNDTEEGVWISPNLQVVDSYYNKTLRVHPGGAHIKLGADKTILAWTGPKDEIVAPGSR